RSWRTLASLRETSPRPHGTTPICPPSMWKRRQSPMMRWWSAASWSAPQAMCPPRRSEEHTSELQSLTNLVCRLLLEKNKPVLDHEQRIDRMLCACAAQRKLEPSGQQRLQHLRHLVLFGFFFNDWPPTEFSPLPPHRALPI